MTRHLVHPNLTGRTLALEDVTDVAARFRTVDLSFPSRRLIERAAGYVQKLLKRNQPVYGINTGFGELARVPIPESERRALQVNLLRSHAAGVGPPFETPVVRAMMLLRANALALGFSGIQTATVELLIKMLNRRVHPTVPSQGSLGASGDLAPLAHLALVLIGEGEAEYDGRIHPGREALRRAGLHPVELEPKEGLALINGTQAITAVASLALLRGFDLLALASVIGGMSLEALLASTIPLDPAFARVRPHPGHARIARELRVATANSGIVRSHENCGTIQDAYSLRTMPQVHGAVADAFAHGRAVIEREINSATDNPLLFPEEDLVRSGGNFHGEPVALVIDYLTIAAAELGSISERRIDRLVNPLVSKLPPFLTKDGGVHSGYMIAQYTAAALVSENKVLSHPASVDSIPTSGNLEDHVSMGTIGARKFAQVIGNLENILAIEFLLAARAADFRKPHALGAVTGFAHDALRAEIPEGESDHTPAHEIAKVRALMRSPIFVDEIRSRLARGVDPADPTHKMRRAAKTTKPTRKKGSK